MEELQFDSIIFQSRSLIDKYEISFNSTSCPIPAPIDLHTKASNYTLLEIVPPDNSHSDWFNHPRRSDISYRLSFWLNSVERVSSDIIISINDIPQQGLLYVLEIASIIKFEWIYMNVDILYGKFAVPIAHGNIKLIMKRSGEIVETDEDDAELNKSKNTVFQRRLSRLLIIKNFKDTDETCELNFNDNSEQEVRSRTRKEIIPTLVNTNQANKRINNTMIINYSYNALINMKTSEWIPKDARSSGFVMPKKVKDYKIDIPPFRAYLGCLRSTVNPANWKMKRSFRILQTMKLSPKELILNSVIKDRSAEGPDPTLTLKNESFSKISQTYSLGELLDGIHKIICSVEDLQLAPDLLEYYRNQRLAVVASYMDRKRRRRAAFLGGIVKMEGRWIANSMLPCGSSNNTAIFERSEEIPEDIESFEIHVITLESPLFGTKTDKETVPKTNSTDHIYDLLERAEYFRDPVIICQGVLTPQNLKIVDNNEDEAYESAHEHLQEFQVIQSNKLVTGLYEVVLFVNNNTEDVIGDMAFIVGKLAINISMDGVVSDKDRTESLSIQVFDKYYNAFTSCDALPDFVVEPSKESRIYTPDGQVLDQEKSIFYDILEVEHVLLILHSLWSRLLLSTCGEVANFYEYPSYFDIPLPFLLSVEQTRAAIQSGLSQNATSIKSYDSNAMIFAIVRSILSRFLDQPRCNDNVFLDLFAARLYDNGTAVMLWLFVQHWLVESPAMQQLVQPKKSTVGMESIYDDDIPLDEWNLIQCVCLSLYILRQMEIKVMRDHNSIIDNEQDDASEYVSVSSLVEDLLGNILSYSLLQFEQVIDHMKSVLQQPELFESEEANSSNIYSTPVESSQNGTKSTNYKSKMKVDQEKKRHEEKNLLIETTLNYLHSQILTPIMTSIGILAGCVEHIPFNCAKMFAILSKYLLQFSKLVFNEYITIEDIESFASPVNLSRSQLSATSKLTSKVKEDERNLSSHKCLARLKIIQLQRMLINVCNKFLLATHGRRKALFEICIRLSPSKWERKGFSSQDPLSMSKVASVVRDHMISCIVDISSFIKKYYRFYVISTVEYMLDPVNHDQLMDEVDMISSEMTNMIRTFLEAIQTAAAATDNVAHHSQPMPGTNLIRDINIPVLFSVSKGHFLLSAAMKMVEALMAINLSIMRLPYKSQEEETADFKVDSIKRDQSSRSSDADSNISILKYIIKHRNRGIGKSQAVESDLADKFNDSIYIDDEFTIINWAPIVNLLQFKIWLVKSIYRKRNMNHEEMRLAFEYISSHSSMKNDLSLKTSTIDTNEEDHTAFDLVTMAIHTAQAINLIWQTIDMISNYNREQYNQMEKEKWLSLRRYLLEWFKVDIDFLTSFVNPLFLIVLHDSEYFHRDDIAKYQRIRREDHIRQLQHDPKYNHSLKDFSLLASTSATNDATSTMLSHHSNLQLPLDKYIGMQHQGMFYGDYKFIDSSKIFSSEESANKRQSYPDIPTVATSMISDGNYISHWLSARYNLLGALSSLYRISATTGLIDVQLLIPSNTSEYEDIFYKVNIWHEIIPRMTIAIQDLCDCTPIHGVRSDMFMLCTEFIDDSEMIIRSLYDIACYIPAFNQTSYHELVMDTKPIYELVSPRHKSKDRSVATASTTKSAANVNIMPPMKISRIWSKSDLYFTVSKYYDLLSDSRYSFLLRILQLPTNISNDNSSNSTKLEQLFMKLTYRAVLCSLPSEDIIFGCPTLLAVFGNEYKFKKLILSTYGRYIYQQGSGHVVQSLFSILELPTSLENTSLVRMREQFYVMSSSVRMYVLGKVFTAFRYALSEEGIHDLHEFSSTDASFNNDFLDINDMNITSKVINLYSSRYDVLAIVSALHTFIRILSISSRHLSDHLIDLKIILHELQLYTKPRENKTGKGDIRLHIPEHDNQESFGHSLQSSNRQKKSNYLQIQDHFIGNLNEIQGFVGHEYLRQSYLYRKSIGVRTDPIEELGQSFIASQGLLDLYLLEYAKNLLGTSQQDNYDYLNDYNDISDQMALQSSIGNFTIEQQQYIHCLERENRLIRKIFHTMEDVGDWESAFVFIERVIKKYNQELKHIEEVVTQAATADASLPAAISMKSNPSSPARSVSTISSRIEVMSSKQYSVSPLTKSAMGQNISQGVMKSTYHSYLLYRYRTLKTELHANLDRIKTRISNDADLRIFPIYYALRFQAEIPLSYSGKHVCSEKDRRNDIFQHLELENFLEATNLTFLGVNTMGSLSGYGQSLRHGDISSSKVEDVMVSGVHDTSRSEKSKKVRFVDLNDEKGVAIDDLRATLDEPLTLDDLGSTSYKKIRPSRRDSGKHTDEIPDNTERRDISMDGLGQGVWILLRYDPTAYIASARVYKRFIECQIKSNQNKDYETDYDRIHTPPPPPSYQAVYSKLQEAFPQYRILSSYQHVEKNDSPIFSSTKNHLNVDEGDLGLATDQVEPPSLQLFQAFPQTLMTEFDAMTMIKDNYYPKEPILQSEESHFIDDGIDKESRSEISDHTSIHSNKEGSTSDRQEVHNKVADESKRLNKLDSPTANEIKATERTSGYYWKQALFAQDFYVFAFEDESREHFYRRYLDKDDLDAPLTQSDDDLSSPRLIRYSLTLNWKPIESNSSSSDKTTNQTSNINDLSESLLLNSSNELPWMAPSGIVFVKQSKRVSVIHALIQLMHYHDKALQSVSDAVKYLLTLSAKEYLQQRPDDIANSDTILIATISTLSNIYVQPAATCLGLHNADTMISAELDHRELIWQQKRKEIRRVYFREIAEYEATVKTLSKSERRLWNKPVEPDFEALEYAYQSSYNHLSGLSKYKEDLSTRCFDILKNLRKFASNLERYIEKKLQASSIPVGKPAITTMSFKSPLDQRFQDGKSQEQDSSNLSMELYENMIVWKSLLLWIEANNAAASGGFPL